MMDDVDRDLARQKLADLIKKAPTRKQLAWLEIQRGTRPEWLAVKYNFTLDEMQRAKAEWERRQEEKPK
jgi:hypothetical protein